MGNKYNREILDLIRSIQDIDYILPKDIPNIELYMDQITTFMDEHLQSSKRFADDKILTKTMINNYTKNNLLPPSNKKKYSKEHMILLIFIYYFKNLLNFNDIETILSYITEHHFGEAPLPLSQVYTEVFTMEHSQMDKLKDDVKAKFETAEKTFSDVEDPGEKDALQLFSFICELAFDVYLKKQMIERLADEIRDEYPPAKKK